MRVEGDFVWWGVVMFGGEEEFCGLVWDLWCKNLKGWVEVVLVWKRDSGMGESLLEEGVGIGCGDVVFWEGCSGCVGLNCL